MRPDMKSRFSDKLQLIVKDNSFFASADQIILSAAGLLISVFVLKTAGVESLGIYSFITVFVHLFHGAVASILHGQMTLRIAGSVFRIQQSFFRVSATLNVVFFLFLLSIVIVLSYIFSKWLNGEEYILLGILGCTTFGVVSFYELSKRYLYLQGLQKQSFAYTLTYLVVLVFLLLLVLVLKPDQKHILVYVLISNIFAFFVALLRNVHFYKAILLGKKQGKKVSVNLLLAYLEQGRYGLVGTVLTWMQNQSITPILMFLAGPLVVGYYNIARLIMMPVMVVNTGLLASALPRLRVLAKKSSFVLLGKEIQKYAMVNLFLCLVFLSTLLLFHWLGLSDRFIPNYRDGLPFLMVWGFVIVVLIYRTWIAQHFIVRMQFVYLLITSLISTIITFASIFAGYYSTGNYYVIAASVALGDVFLLIVFYSRLSKNKVAR